MNRERAIWWLIFLVAGGFLLYRATLSPQGMGKVYIKPAVRSATAPVRPAGPVTYVVAQPSDPQARLSWPRTLGLWAAAFFTLAIFSFLYRDNAFYRFAEAVMVGVSAAYFMVAAFWDGIVPKLVVRLANTKWSTPAEAGYGLLALIPLVLSVMLLWRLMPRGGWISRWPLAFIVGTYAGIRMISFLEADFVSQIRNTIVPLAVMTQTGQFDLWATVRNLLMLTGVVTSLSYFYFSIDHRGVYGRIAQVGVWYLMITFGASFAFTVMGRIALLAARLEFLFDDWLWLIDPLGNRKFE